MEKIKLLVSARDPATAEAVKILIKSILNDGCFDLQIVAQEPAYSSLLVMEEQIEDRLHFYPHHGNVTYLIESSKEFVERISPDIIMTGISGPDAGIDEAILTIASQSKFSPYALQSYWGDVNKFLPALAQTYLVLDDFAAKKTAEITGKRTVVVGSLKHEGYENLNPIELRKLYRNKIKKENNQLLIGFLGQPLEGVNGYAETVSMFSETVKMMQPDSTIIYRPHPKESHSLKQWTIHQFNGMRTSLLISDTTDKIEPFLSGVDVVASAFSTCGYDLQQILRFSSQPLGVPIYLMMNSELKSWYQSFTNLDSIPMTANGMAVVVYSKDDLKDFLRATTINQQRKLCWKSVKKGFPSVKSSSSQIIKLLKEDYESK